MLGHWLWWTRWNVTCDLELSSSLCHCVRHSSSLTSFKFKSKLKTRLFSSACSSVVFFSLYQPITSNACIHSECDRERESVCVCVCARERERESVFVCVMKWAFSCAFVSTGFSQDGVQWITYYYYINFIHSSGLQLVLCSSQPHGRGPISDATPFTRQPIAILCQPVAPVSMTYSSGGYRVGLAAISWT